MTSAAPAFFLFLSGLLLLPPAASSALLEVVIEPVAGGEPLKLDSLTLRNQAGETWSVTRLSYLIGDVSLQTADGSWLPLPGAAGWMSAADGRNRLRLPDTPPGEYRALRFHVGLNPEQNNADPASWPAGHALNPNVNGLHWSWQGGYIFLALEGRFQSGGGAPKGYAFHLAREPFRASVTLPARFELKDRTVLRLRLDAAALVDGARAISFAADGVSTHSKDGDPLAEALRENVAAAFRMEAVENPRAVEERAALPPAPEKPAQTPYRLTINSAFPQPLLPADNPLLKERVALGQRLFQEPALSRDGTLSCASCHQAQTAFSDPRRLSPGVGNRTGNRNAMPLFNLAWKQAFFWDGRTQGLRAQVLEPIQDHREMDETLDNVVAKLTATPDYAAAFERAFGSPAITPERLALALENFLLTLVSGDSKFDRALRGEAKLTAQEQRGFDLFMTEREPRLGSLGGDCFHCHGGPLFTDHQFRNNGLAIEESDLGRFLVSQISIDRGAFATPSLRNVALTAPYMHDGRFATLEEVLDHYSEGVQRTDTLDPNLAKHPDGGLHLDAEEKAALIAFLKTLTDDRFTTALSPTQD